MKAYKLEILIVDSDFVGSEDIKTIIENQKYPNHCISPMVMKIEEKDIGEWSDDHPLNKRKTFEETYKKLFNH
jgi:hypothetical protein